MKILNLYAGIGGNRKFWGDEHDITAVELDERRADIYKNNFPKDTIIIGDAHQYLLEHYTEYDFIWSSPPCQSHSRVNYFLNAKGVVRYPDMGLWQEIIFLKEFYKGLFCVENVKSYYTPLIPPFQLGRHYLWSNFPIPKITTPKKQIGRMNGKNQGSKNQDENNCVAPMLGKHILDCALKVQVHRNQKQTSFFQ